MKTIWQLALMTVQRFYVSFLWKCRQNQETESEESYQSNTRKLERLAEIVKDKLLEADVVYAVYSEKTGEPYLFSTTYDRGEEGYLCTDPMIMLLTPSWYRQFKETIDSRPNSVVKLIENTEDKKGIENFLGIAFYLMVPWEQSLIPRKSASVPRLWFKNQIILICQKYKFL